MTMNPRLFELAALGEVAIFGQPKMATRYIHTEGATKNAIEKKRESVCVVCGRGNEDGHEPQGGQLKGTGAGVVMLAGESSIGTSRRILSGDARGNSRGYDHSFFRVSDYF